MRQHRLNRPATRVFPWIPLAALVATLLAALAAGAPGALAAVAGERPDGAPPFDPEAHAREAAGTLLEEMPAEPVPALLETGRFALPWPAWIELLGDEGGWSWLRHQSRAPVFVETDPVTLEFRRTIPYRRDGEDNPFTPSSWAFVQPPETPPLLVVSSSASSEVRVFDVGGIPGVRPSLEGFPSGTRVSAVGDGSSVLLHNSSGLRLYYMGNHARHDFPRAWRRAWALAGPRDHRLLLDQVRLLPPDDGWRLDLWDLADPQVPVLLRSGASPVEEIVTWFLAGDGSFAAWVESASGQPTVVHVIDLSTYEEISRVEGPAGSQVLLSDTPAGRYLVFFAGGQAASWSLADPASPELLAEADLGTCDADGRCPGAPWVVSRDEPVAFGLDRAAPGAVALDVRTLERLGHWRAPEGECPGGFLLREPARGGRRVVVSLRRSPAEGAVPGLHAQASIDWADPANPREDAHRVLVEPTGEEAAFATLGGRWLVAWHPDENALAVIDTATGRVTGWEGIHEAEPVGAWWNLAAGGRRLVLPRPYGLAEVFDLDENGAPAWRGAFPFAPNPDAGARGAAVRDDGLAAIVYDGGVQFVLPDGTAGPAVTLDVSTWYAAFSPDGTRLLTWGNTAWGMPAGMAMVDVSVPAAPAVLWTRNDVGGHPAFVRDGRAIATLVPAWGVSVALLDAATGEFLGDATDVVPTWFYFGGGTPFGAGSEERVAWWMWTWHGWRTLLYDVSADTPEMALESPEYRGSPHWVPVDDGSGLREAHESFGVTWRDLWVYRPDGSIEEPGQVAFRSAFVPLRWGFMAGGDSRDLAGFATWRDPEMNRPPVARAGEDRVLECAGPAGTPTVLDGSGTTDPDSTPGTQDDLAAFRWEESGERICEEATCEASFPVGEHLVTLFAEDVLGAVGTDDVTVTVQDTLPPEVELTVDPQVEQGNDRSVFLGTWVADGSVTDRCDGDLGQPLVVLLEDASVLAAPWRYEPAEEERVVVLAGETGPEVVLYGPNEALVVEHWTWAVEHGGWHVQAGWPTSYWWGSHAPSPLPAGVLEEVFLAPCGKVLVAQRSEAYGDFVFEGRGEDAAGHEATARVSLRERIAEACADLPPGAECRW